MIYVPNVGEKEMLKDILASGALVLGLFKNNVIPDGNTIIDTLEELPTGGGRGYAQVALTNDVLESATAVADKWTISTDSNGKALGTYDNASQSWTFTAIDVADGNYAYGVFGFTWVLPFDTGTQEIKVGDTVKGATSGATGIVTSIKVFTGTWGGGTAAGEMVIKTKTGTFQDSEDILVLGEVGTVNGTPTAAGTGYAAGDIVEITAVGENCLCVVVTVGGGGSVTSVVKVTGGKGYSTGAGKATTKVTGGGDDALTLNITALASTAYAKTNTGATADAHKRLMFVDAFSTAQQITPTGFTITYPAAITLGTSA